MGTGKRCLTHNVQKKRISSTVKSTSEQVHSVNFYIQAKSVLLQHSHHTTYTLNAKVYAIFRNNAHLPYTQERTDK